ncbi:MAG: thioredoxin, partial [Gammaproteobacteria bacterium]|nr:thioredoxin [Gammaproteobacteria bacterium]
GLYMATLTLTRMAEGGLFDQLGGGFSRYSVDELWMIPHFEKMLYDNGQLLHAYASASLATGDALFARIAGETADWIMRDMRSPEGGFYSSLDADSEGHEGSFYVWSRAEAEALLTPGEYSLFARRFGLNGEANFEGRWHLHAHESLEPRESGESPTRLPAESAEEAIDSARRKLLAARNLRVWPARDEKILTSWNALTVKGLAIAGRALNRPDLVAAAGAAVDFIRRHLWRDGRLLATYKDGRAHIPAYLDDYAFLADALLELLQSRWRSSDLEFARALVEVLLAKFEDSEGGFYFTASDHERLILRSKTFSDDSVPSGNGVAASVLCRMGYLLGEIRYLNAAERSFKAAWASMHEFPQAHMSLLNAFEDFLAPTQTLIIRGPAEASARWARNLNVLYAPTRMIFAIPGDAPDLPAALADKQAGSDVTGYLCAGMTCSEPLTDLGEIARKLASRLDS